MSALQARRSLTARHGGWQPTFLDPPCHGAGSAPIHSPWQTGLVGRRLGRPSGASLEGLGSGQAALDVVGRQRMLRCCGSLQRLAFASLCGRRRSFVFLRQELLLGGITLQQHAGTPQDDYDSRLQKTWNLVMCHQNHQNQYNQSFSNKLESAWMISEAKLCDRTSPFDSAIRRFESI